MDLEHYNSVKWFGQWYSTQPKYVYIELKAFWRGGVKWEYERFKLCISLWEPQDAGLFLLCHTFPFGHTGSFRCCVTPRGELKGSKCGFSVS